MNRAHWLDGSLDDGTGRPYLTHPAKLGNGAFQFSFSNPSGASFTVFATTNMGLPASSWAALGSPTNAGGGMYQFTDPNAAKYPVRFYELRSP